MKTDHVDKVYGWIVVILGLTIFACILAVCLARGLTPVVQASLINIAVGSVGALASALSLRENNAPPDTQQQVTIPSADPAVAPITVSTGSPSVPPTL